MILKITSGRQVAFPAGVPEALGLGPGDRVRPEEGPDGHVPRPRRIDYSRTGTLRGKIKPGTPPFDLEKFREQPHGPSLRD